MSRKRLIGLAAAFGACRGSGDARGGAGRTAANQGDLTRKGERLTPGAGVIFEVKIPPPYVPVGSVEVSSQDGLGPDGELADSFAPEHIVLVSENTSNPDIYQGTLPFRPAKRGHLPRRLLRAGECAVRRSARRSTRCTRRAQPSIHARDRAVAFDSALRRITGVKSGSVVLPSLTVGEAYVRVKLAIRRHRLSRSPFATPTREENLRRGRV